MAQEKPSSNRNTIDLGDTKRWYGIRDARIFHFPEDITSSHLESEQKDDRHFEVCGGMMTCPSWRTSYTRALPYSHSLSAAENRSIWNHGDIFGPLTSGKALLVS